MSDVVNLLERVGGVDVSPEFTNYSKVRIIVDDETVIEVGDDTARTLEVENPLGTHEMAERMLQKLRGFQYQPYSFDGAVLPPEAEMGDAASAHDVYGGIYRRERRFGRLMRADISAPLEQEIDHEYKFVSKQERNFNRQIGDVRASLIIQSNEIRAEVQRLDESDSNLSSLISQTAEAIEAKVSATGGDSRSFGWTLDSAGFKLVSNNRVVLDADSQGITVSGSINATTGAIGGFTIAASALYNGMTSRDDTAHNGVYVGTNGIACGAGNFKVQSNGYLTAGGGNFTVDTGGNVSAKNMNLSGTLTIAGRTITADALRSGAQSAYSNGGTWTSGVTSWNNAKSSNSGIYPNFFKSYRIDADEIRVGSNGSMMIKGQFVSWASDSWYDRDGKYHYIRYLTY